MSIAKIKTLLETDSLWNNINAQLKRKCREIGNMSYNYSNSRTLQAIGNATYQHYGRHIYELLAGLCGILDNNKKLRITSYYKTISSEEAAETPTIESLVSLLGLQDPGGDRDNQLRICLYHIPKGISFLRKIVDNTPALNRLENFETMFADNPQQFIRVYKGFGGLNPNDIVIFSNTFSEYTIHSIFTCLPHIFNLNPYVPAENTELTPFEINYNRKLDLVFELFSILFEAHQSLNEAPYFNGDLTTIQQRINDITNRLAALFDFSAEELNTFIENLAKNKNKLATKHFQSKLKDTELKIKDYETQLEKAYNELRHYQQQILCTSLVSIEDVKPFFETIQSTKAIEVLDSTPTQLTLRITAPVQYFTEADIRAYNRNESSDYNYQLRQHPTLKRILNKVFDTREYQMLFQSVIIIEINNSSYADTPLIYRAQKYTTENLTEFPNPHLWHHNCWDRAQSEMKKNINEGNYDLVVMQMIAATQSINIAEGASFIRGFLGDITNNDECKRLAHFIIPDKELGKRTVTLQELLEIEKGLEKQDIVEQAKEELEVKQIATAGYAQVEIPDDDANWTEPVIRQVETYNATTDAIPNIHEAIQNAMQAALAQQEGDNNEEHNN